jgi:3-deoxy-7-phosphoheptulonate synthase
MKEHVTHGEVPEALFRRLGEERDVGIALLELGRALRDRIDARTFELVALRCAASRKSLYEWRGHCRIALARDEAGLGEDDIARVALGPGAFEGGDRAVLEAVDELLTHRRLSASTRAAIGDLELAVTLAVHFYDTIATVMAGTSPDAAPVLGLGTPHEAAHAVGVGMSRAGKASTSQLFDEIFGDPTGFTLIAGPCSVTDRSKTVRVAQLVRAAGASLFRGGAYKPRSDPGSFQGLGELGLLMLLDAKLESGLPIVTELLDVRNLDTVLAVADVVQVGARNMHNTALLKELGKIDRPVLLKRGFGATIEETIKASAYITAGGNHRVILCERGIRTFETAYRSTLDLNAVLILKESGLPVFVDPSHAPGRREHVLALSKAAVAVGADGLIVEVDEDPEAALSDPRQQLDVDGFGEYAAELTRVVEAEGRRLLSPSGEPAATGG